MNYFTYRVTYSPLIWDKYLDQPLRVISSNLKVLLPPLFSVYQEQPDTQRQKDYCVSDNCLKIYNQQ